MLTANWERHYGTNTSGAQFADISELDITKRDSVEAFDWSGIEIVLNAAAFTNVDGAETDEGRVAAWNVNAAAVANLSENLSKTQHDFGSYFK